MLDCSMYLVQDKDKLFTRAVSQTQNGMNIIYSNCISHIKIDGDTLKTNKYSTLLYNEESNTSIILQKDGRIDKQRLIESVPENSICEVGFNKLHQSSITNNPQYELIFCNNDGDLENTIRDQINEGKDRCYYYTDITFLFQMGYITKKGYHSYIIEKHGEGMVKFNNTLIFLDRNYDRNNNIPVWEIIERYGIKLRIREDINYQTKKRVKTLI